MFDFFKKIKTVKGTEECKFNYELIGIALAYEVAISDGEIDGSELSQIKKEIENKSKELDLNSDDIFKTIKKHSEESTSFNDFINQINQNFSKDKKLKMIEFLWGTAFADQILEVNEERLIRRIASMIRIKDMQVLKLKDQARKNI